MENIESAIFLSMLGDIIGFGNGFNEFNNNTFFTKDNFDNYEADGADYSSQMVFDFLYNGGFVNHPQSDWTISDDTMMMFANAESLIEWNKQNVSDLILIIKRNYIALINSRKKLEDFEVKYKGGIATITSLKRLMKGDDYKQFTYNDRAGGSGGTMRSGIIGIVLHDSKLKLIEACIESTLLTHVNAIAFLGSVVAALFASYAFEKMRPEKWCIEMMEVLESNIIDNYIKKYWNSIYDFYDRDKKIFINKWKDYIEDKFDDQSFKYKKSTIMKYPSQRSLYYNKFSHRKNEIYPGAGGDDSVIIAYDCFMDCDGSWEKAVIYSMLHVGDSDTTGSICGLFFGLYYGYDKMAKIMKNNIIGEKCKANNIINNLLK